VYGDGVVDWVHRGKVVRLGSDPRLRAWTSLTGLMLEAFFFLFSAMNKRRLCQN
jgi:hypothetical protein